MRITLVMEYHPEDKTGGAEVQTFAVARQLASAGHSVTYVCQALDLSRESVQVVDGVLVWRAVNWHRAFHLLGAWQLHRAIARSRPDVVYKRYASAFAGLAAISARLLRVPFVWGCAQDESLNPAFLRRRPASENVGFMRRLKNALLMVNGCVDQALFDFAVKSATAVIVQNDDQLELLEANYRRRGVIIPNGILLRDAVTMKDRRPVVLWLNRITRGKQPEAFVEMAQRLGDELPEAACFLVGGRRDDAYMRQLRLLSEGVQGLTLVGEVPQSETREWFDRAWVYVLTSASEGFPNVLLQAWEAGTPVVSLEVDPGGLLQREGLGILAGSAPALAASVARLISDEAMRLALARHARAYVAAHYDLGVVACQYEKLFASITGG